MNSAGAQYEALAAQVAKAATAVSNLDVESCDKALWCKKSEKKRYPVIARMKLITAAGSKRKGEKCQTAEVSSEIMGKGKPRMPLAAG